MKHKVVQLGAMFVWHLAKFAVREAAWMTADAARRRMRARQRIQTEPEPPRPRDLRQIEEPEGKASISYGGPAGYRVSSHQEPHEEI